MKKINGYQLILLKKFSELVKKAEPSSQKADVCVKGTSCGVACIDSKEDCLIKEGTDKQVQTTDALKNLMDAMGDKADSTKIKRKIDQKNSRNDRLVKGNPGKPIDDDGGLLKLDDLPEEGKARNVINQGKKFIKDILGVDLDGPKTDINSFYPGDGKEILRELADKNRISPERLKLASSDISFKRGKDSKTGTRAQLIEGSNAKEIINGAKMISLLTRGQNSTAFDVISLPSKTTKDGKIRPQRPGLKPIGHNYISAPDPKDKKLSARTIMHEMSHAIEKDSKKMADLAVDFIISQSKTGKVKEQKLKDLFPDIPNIKDNEIVLTNEDDSPIMGGDPKQLRSHYAAKIYKNAGDDQITNTEVYSMGIEKFLGGSSLESFVEENPDYAAFIIGVFESDWGSTKTTENSDKYRINTPLAPIPIYDKQEK